MEVLALGLGEHCKWLCVTKSSLIGDCSYRFMDMFPDVEHVRDMQRELDQIIQAGVVNITKLLRNSETSVSSGVAEDGEDEFEIQQRVQQRSTADDVMDSSDDEDGRYMSTHQKTVKAKLRTKSSDSDPQFVLKSGQRLTDQLVRQGLLTKSMLKQIHQELSENVSKDDETDTPLPGNKEKWQINECYS